MASRNDVAREAGVSPTSVSYYINQNGYVSEASAKKIQAAIEKLNYCPNQIAKSLKTKNNRQFIFLCNEIMNPFFTQLISSAMKKAYQERYTVLFSNVVDDEAYLQQLCSYQASGIFLPNGRIRRSVLETICKNQIPIIMLTDNMWENLPKNITQIQPCSQLVYPDIIRHLIQQGYRSIQFLTTVTDDVSAMQNTKIKALLEAVNGQLPTQIVYGISGTRAARDYMLDRWVPESAPQAILCSNDAIAQGALYALSKRNVRVPEDVGIIGHDDTLLSQFSSPEISSVSIDTDLLGETIIDMLIRRANGKAVGDYSAVPVFLPRRSSMRCEDRQMP